MSIIIIGLTVIIGIVLVSKMLGADKEAIITTLSMESMPTEVVIVKAYRGKTKMAAIKAIREVNPVISLKDAKSIVDNGGELELYVAKDHLYQAEEMMGETGLDFKPKN